VAVTTIPVDQRPVDQRQVDQRPVELERELEQTVRTLQRLVRSAEPGSVSGDQARRVVALFAECERAASSGVSLFAPVVAQTGSFAKAGHGSAADWLGALSGSSASAARGRLTAAGHAALDPVLTDALHGAELSTAQLTLVARAAVEAPGSTGDLLGLVGQGASHQELHDAAARLRAAARSAECERARRSRVHSLRHLRWHQDDGGGIRGEFLCDEVAWARVAPVLEAEATRRWRRSGSTDSAAPSERDALDAHRLDAFIDLLANSGGSQRGARPQAVVVIDAEALRRGSAQGDELCEIEGIGPVSVQAATELLSDAGLRYLVKEGFDIRTVTRSTRDIARCIDMALIVRDRTCAVPGCGKRLGLERDHWRVDYAKDGPTELDNLVRLCAAHHDMKTNGGWRLTGGPGHWGWVPPANPPGAGRIARARKLAAARAAAIVRKKGEPPPRGRPARRPAPP
jgi:hypothetical protein